MKQELERDTGGYLFDPRVRNAMTQFTRGDGTLALEAAAAVRAASHAVERMRARGAGTGGLSAGALDILIRLSAVPDDGISIGDLAQAAGVSSRNITGLVDTLERDGLAQRVPDRRDRRSVRAQITAAGREWMDSFRLPTQVAMSAIFHGFTPAELTQLRDLCLRLVDSQRRIEQHLSEGGGAADTGQ
jgi:DNA-binding MarR family transcriptional regulator